MRSAKSLSSALRAGQLALSLRLVVDVELDAAGAPGAQLGVRGDLARDRRALVLLQVDVEVLVLDEVLVDLEDLTGLLQALRHRGVLVDDHAVAAADGGGGEHDLAPGLPGHAVTPGGRARLGPRAGEGR